MTAQDKETLLKIRELFMTYGIRSMTMDDIARNLGVSKRTLYEHFKDKADIIRKIVFLEVERIGERMQEIMQSSENIIEAMLKVNEYVVEMQKNTPQNVKFDLEKYYPAINDEIKRFTEEKMFVTIKENLQIGQKQGVIRDDLNIDIIAALQVGRSYFIDIILGLVDDADYQEVLNEIFDYHIRAVATNKGLEIYHKIKYQK